MENHVKKCINLIKRVQRIEKVLLHKHDGNVRRMSTSNRRLRIELYRMSKKINESKLHLTIEEFYQISNAVDWEGDFTYQDFMNNFFGYQREQ